MVVSSFKINANDKVSWFNEKGSLEFTGKVIERVRAKSRPRCEAKFKLDGKARSTVSYVVDVNNVIHWINHDQIASVVSVSDTSDVDIDDATPTPSISASRVKVDFNQSDKRRIGVDDTARKHFDSLQGFGKPYISL